MPVLNQEEIQDPYIEQLTLGTIMTKILHVNTKLSAQSQRMNQLQASLASMATTMAEIMPYLIETWEITTNYRQNDLQLTTSYDEENKKRFRTLSNHLQGFVNDNVDVILEKVAAMNTKIADETRSELRNAHVKLVGEFTPMI